jgi:homoserine O-succinyltransferase
MIGSAFDAVARPRHSELEGGLAPIHGDVVTIALINNMPDAALQSTERHFCALLDAASGGMIVKLKLYSIPGIQRSDATRAHIARYYEEFGDLHADPPDGIIVTGTEPIAQSLHKEPYWTSLSWLVDWVDDCAIPSIWSCLAAHAAVLQLDGIERHPLGTKLSGVFECQISAHRHHIFHGLPNRWNVPHSRHNGLRESALLAAGYSILSRSRAVGPDIFLRHGRALQLFFQGHPEYRATTILGEYRRDVIRYLNGTREIYPDIPRGYFSPLAHAAFTKLAAEARKQRDPSTLSVFDNLASEQLLRDHWFVEARRIYVNWLCYVRDVRTRRPRQASFARSVSAPAHAAV